VHGEPRLDHVVPAEGTSEYSQLIAGAQTVQMEDTGHLGSITRPDRFARILGEFLGAKRQRTHDSAA
jgi:pimeloyl-ACP methyl ester carboxylesterase